MIILIIIVSIMIIRQSNDDHQVWSSTTAAGWRDGEILPVLALLTLFALRCRSPPSWMISSPFSFPLVSKLFRITLAGLNTWGRVPSFAVWSSSSLSSSFMMIIIQDYSGWASYMGAGAILCCLASALAGISLSPASKCHTIFHSHQHQNVSQSL